ncbi:hypothetical protein ACFE04_015235 [Oxalis oulophora]
MKELSILKSDNNILPTNSIYVRAYEEDVGLFRAAIMGLPGTPYHHGLFFFDLEFRSGYPDHILPIVSYSKELMDQTYNVYAFIASCKLLMKIKNNPPFHFHFEDIVENHIQMNGKLFLKACKAYQQGRVSVGFYEDGVSKLSPPTKIPTNLENKLATLYSKLDQTLFSPSVSTNLADQLHTYLHQIRSAIFSLCCDDYTPISPATTCLDSASMGKWST